MPESGLRQFIVILNILRLNNLNDLYSLFKFIKVKQFDKIDSWSCQNRFERKKWYSTQKMGGPLDWVFLFSIPQNMDRPAYEVREIECKLSTPEKAIYDMIDALGKKVKIKIFSQENKIIQYSQRILRQIIAVSLPLHYPLVSLRKW